MIQKNHLQAFVNTDEKINLIFPIIGLVLAFCEIGLFWKFSMSQQFWFNALFAGAFFAFGVHNSFTVALLMFFKPFQDFWKERQQQNGRQDVYNLIFICLFVFVMVFFYRSLSNWFFLYLTLFHVLTNFHTLRQHLGISLIYNTKLKACPELPQSVIHNLQRSERWERILYNTLISCQLVWLFTLRWLNQSKQIVTLVLISQVAMAALIIVFLLIDKFVFHSPRNKTVFHLRLMLYPLQSFSSLAILFTRGCHGIEYFMVFRKMLQQPKNNGGSKQLIVWSVALLIILTSITIAYSYLASLPQNASWQWPIFFLLAAAHINSFSHYYLDRILFRMKDPLCRNKIGALLIQDNFDSISYQGIQKT